MKIPLCAAAAFASLFAFVPLSSTLAGQLFPPSNIGVNPNAACPNNEVLTWTSNGTVECLDPTAGVNFSCPAGQVLNSIGVGKQLNCVTPTTRDPFRVWANMEGFSGWPTAVVASYRDGYGHLQHFLMQISNHVVDGPVSAGSDVAYVSADALAGGSYCGYYKGQSNHTDGSLSTTYNLVECPPQLTLDGSVVVQPLP